MDVMSALHKFRATEAPIDKFMYLRALLLDKRDVFEWILMDHTEEVLPFIYTPTVGEACQRYDELGVETHGEAGARRAVYYACDMTTQSRARDSSAPSPLLLV